ncbi:Late embryogenesis abundant protein-like protein [Perilla frutescens var. hirtella]|nr:Late embryogenesis abundant protein-like protein [Perilla frutescens var. hirtella]
MKIFSCKSLFIILLICASIFPHIFAQKQENVVCTSKKSPCFLKKITCPTQCPYRKPKDPKAKACYINCDSPICKAECRYRKPSCNGVGAACYDPRFIGADGAVFYFHGKSNEHFSLVSDSNVQINARFIGHRPSGRSRDYTWIQALGILFGSHSFSVEATKAATWDSSIDHLRFFFDGDEVFLPQGALSSWESARGEVVIERVSSTNSAIISLPETMEIGVNVVPITKEDDRIHNYQIPSDDCFSHLEVQFRFLDLSPEVEGVLGRTYRPDYESQAILGIAMPVVGGEDKYRTTSLLAADCKKCVFSSVKKGDRKPTINHGMMDCSDKFSTGNGIACKK